MSKPALNPAALRAKARQLGPFRLVAGGIAAGLFVVTFIGAGAAPIGTDSLSEVLGLHGQTVSQAVHDAKTNLEEGASVGAAVSEAACTAAHDRTTLPQGAQDAAGQVDRELKDCTHPSNAASEEEPTGEDADETAAVEEEAADETDEVVANNGEQGSHGAAVSEAVHAAKEEAQTAGEKIGPAVSEAACMAAHDRSTLPQGAQDAAGQAGREPKDCTHPSNAAAAEDTDTDTQTDDTSTARGKASAPGQQRKNQ